MANSKSKKRPFNTAEARISRRERTVVQYFDPMKSQYRSCQYPCRQENGVGILEMKMCRVGHSSSAAVSEKSRNMTQLSMIKMLCGHIGVAGIGPDPRSTFCSIRREPAH